MTASSMEVFSASYRDVATRSECVMALRMQPCTIYPPQSHRAPRIYFLCTRNLTPRPPRRRSVTFGRNQATQCSLTHSRQSESTTRDVAQFLLPAWSITRPKTTKTPCFTPISHTAGGSSSRSASGIVCRNFAFLQRVPAWKDSAAVRAASEIQVDTHAVVGSRSALAHRRSQDGRAAAKRPAWRPQVQPAMSPQAVLDRLKQVETLSGSPATSVRRRRLIFGGEQRGQECQSKVDSP